MKGRCLAIGLLVAALAAPVRGQAPPPEVANPHLGEALQHIQQGDLDAARVALREAMASPENSNRILVEIYRNLALVNFYAGEENRAYEAFARLLNIDPEYRLPAHTAEPVRRLFQKVKDAYAEGYLQPVRVAHDPIGTIPSGAPVTVSATISNMQETFRARVHFRPTGTESYTIIDMAARPGNRWVATLPPVAIEPGTPPQRIEYYLEATDAEGRRVQGVGSALEPLTYRVESPVPRAPEPPPVAAWYTRPWVWIVAGVVAVGGTAAVVLATSDHTGTLPVVVRVEELP